MTDQPATELDRLRRRLTSSRRPAIFAFTRIEAKDFPQAAPRLAPGRSLAVEIVASAPVERLHVRLFEESTGALAADLGPVDFEATSEGGLACAPRLPSALPPGRFCVVLEGADSQGRTAGGELSLQVD